jgi:acetyl-CoA carboxylase biotin carboxyl carrier protein
MRETTIRKLVKLVESSDIESLNIKTWFSNVLIVKRNPHAGNGNGGHGTMITIPKAQAAPTMPPLEPAAMVASAAAQAVASSPQAAVASQPAAAPVGTKEIKSPMVGTFYTSPEPGVPPFIEVGARVTKGQTVCIIEAMKLMNEIEAEFDGVLVKRMAENAQPVEFGQVLFIVQPA